MPIRVGMVSLGCSKNLVDSERMLAKLRAHGYQLVTEPGEADVAIVNTCGFIQSAKEEAIETILTEGEMSPNLLRARQYIADIYAAMGITVTISTIRTANGIRMELRSDNKSGTIIGRRGETLDSIQYLASILVNKDSEDYCRLLLDSNGYREKRRKTLEQLAEKIARSVLRSGRSTTL